MKANFEITEIQKNIVQVAGIDSEGCLVEVRGPGKAIIINKMGHNAVLLENEWQEFVKAVNGAIKLAKAE